MRGVFQIDPIGFVGSITNLHGYINNNVPNSIDLSQSYSVAQGSLARNPDCGSNQTEIPVTKSRLEEIARARNIGTGGGRGTFQDAVGTRFEQVALQSGSLTPNTRHFESPARNVLTGGKHRGVIPDSVGDMAVVQTVDGVPTSAAIYPNSGFFEVKAASEGTTIALSSYEYQPAGLLDVAERSPARGAGHIPRIIFIVTEDVRISNDLRLDAQAAGVAIWRIVVHESCKEPGILKNGPAIPLNRNVYPPNAIPTNIGTSRSSVRF